MRICIVYQFEDSASYDSLKRMFVVFDVQLFRFEKQCELLDTLHPLNVILLA